MSILCTFNWWQCPVFQIHIQIELIYFMKYQVSKFLTSLIKSWNSRNIMIILNVYYFVHSFKFHTGRELLDSCRWGGSLWPSANQVRLKMCTIKNQCACSGYMEQWASLKVPKSSLFKRNKPKMAYSRDLPKMARQQCGIMDWNCSDT